MKRSAFGADGNDEEHSDEEPIVLNKEDPERELTSTIKYLEVCPPLPLYSHVITRLLYSIVGHPGTLIKTGEVRELLY